MRRILLPLLALPLLAATTPNPLTPVEVAAAATDAEWRDVDPAHLMLLRLGDGGEVAIALAPQFAPVHVSNIEALVRRGWFDGASVYRVQDNYVVQWGDGTEKKPLPPGIRRALPAEYARPLAGLGFRSMGYRDAYAGQTGHANGWPVASDGRAAWLPHCYGMVGVGRDIAPDTGTGAELYAVIGDAPRQLDRNIALVGRVIGGMETLSARPRGPGSLGVFTDPARWIPIRDVRIASDLPPVERPRWQLLRTDSTSFRRWLTVRANRMDAFYIRPAGGLDVCNALPPARRR